MKLVDWAGILIVGIIGVVAVVGLWAAILRPASEPQPTPITDTLVQAAKDLNMDADPHDGKYGFLFQAKIIAELARREKERSNGR